MAIVNRAGVASGAPQVAKRSYTTTPMLEIKFIIRAAFLRDCISDGVCVRGRRRLKTMYVGARNVEGSS